jgi:sRNA-binding regulator protein Hfq
MLSPYQLKTFQGVRVALYAFNKKELNGGVADFDDFMVEEPMADRTKLFFKLFMALADFMILSIASNVKCPSFTNTLASRFKFGNTRNVMINQINAILIIMPGILIVPS